MYGYGYMHVLYACMHVCMYVMYLYVCMHVCMHVGMCICSI